jgi:hypothetical protein
MNPDNSHSVKIDMDSLKSTFKKTRTPGTEECPMVDLTIDYALGDPDLDEQSEIKDHIQTCRYCLDMFLDVRAAKSQSESLEGKKVDILPGLQEVLKRDKPSSPIWEKIRNIFSGETLFSPKPIGILFAACLVLFVSIYGLLDRPVTVEIMLHGRSFIGFRGGNPVYEEIQLKRGGTLKSNDSFRIQAKIDQDAFVYVIFHDSSDKISFIKKGYINAGQEILMPDMNNWYQLDKNAGTETIYVLASRNEIKRFESMVEELKKTGVDTISRVFPETSIQSFSFKHQ